jgi:methylenetetrahydrofolate dehydrogenase (NADP+) / methenyltetrahydrofolate cyclohydrolase
MYAGYLTTRQPGERKVAPTISQALGLATNEPLWDTDDSITCNNWRPQLGTRINCETLFASKMAATKGSAEQLARMGQPATLATVLVGNNSASMMYVEMKQKIAHEISINSRDVRLRADISQADLTQSLAELSGDPQVDAILVQYPIPSHLDYTSALLALDPKKDVDGLHPMNLGLLVSGSTAGILPCTPSGIIEILQQEFSSLDGLNVTVVGRGMTVGRPLGIMLSLKEFALNANVTQLHARTGADVLAASVQGADIVVGAAGIPGLIKPEWINKSSVLIAAGVSFPHGKAVSDFAEGCREQAKAWTPTTGAVGAMTRALLFHNVIRCAELSRT